MIPLVQTWHRQVDELAAMGAWLDRSLPAGTVIATYANGALSYNAADLTVVDLLGLTDEHIARHGQRDPLAMVGHQANDYPYIINVRRPEVIAPSGFGYAHERGCGLDGPYDQGYVARQYQVAGRSDTWATVLLREDRAGAIEQRLSNGAYQLVPCP